MRSNTRLGSLWVQHCDEDKKSQRGKFAQSQRLVRWAITDKKGSFRQAKIKRKQKNKCDAKDHILEKSEKYTGSITASARPQEIVEWQPYLQGRICQLRTWSH